MAYPTVQDLDLDSVLLKMCTFSQRLDERQILNFATHGGLRGFVKEMYIFVQIIFKEKWARVHNHK